MSLEDERRLVERRKKLADAARVILDEVHEIDAQIAAARVKRIAALDARLAEREAEAQRERRRDQIPFNERAEERQERTA